MRIPIFLFLGLLESGKTAFIKQLLQKPVFADGKDTLVIACEEGIEEYEKLQLEKNHITLVTVDSEVELTSSYIKKLNSQYTPQRVIIEYNGMWQLEKVFTLDLPNDWFIYQVMNLINAETFSLYMANMRSIMMEHCRYSDLVIINRTVEETSISSIRGTVKAVNSRAKLFIASSTFEMEAVKEVLPYNLEEELIEIADEHYGLWYIDLWENPERYDKKKFKVSGLFFQQPDDPKDRFSFGRFAMPCCEEDITFMGVYCHNIGKPKFHDQDSIQIVAEVRYEKEAVYQGEAGPVLYVKSIERAATAQSEFVIFN